MTVASASPVPVIVGVASFVFVGLVGSNAESNNGTAGSCVSISMEAGSDGELGFPAGSVCVADRLTTPSGNVSDDVMLHVPSDSTVIVPISVSVLPLPSRSTSAVTITVALGSPVPSITG